MANQIKLSKEEKDILESFEKGEWIESKITPKERKKLQEYAKATLRKDKRVNIRISARDLTELQRKAVEEGLPYQTFISSILHKYVNGRLKDTR